MPSFPVQHWNLGIGPISCHAWNRDRTMLAVSPSNNEIHIFQWKNGQWRLTELLSEHDLPITGLDWAPKTNRIVSCAQDKNAFVWTFDGEHWKPELVVVRMQRAATCVRWSPYDGTSLSWQRYVRAGGDLHKTDQPEACARLATYINNNDAFALNVRAILVLKADSRFISLCICFTENKFAVGSGAKLVSVCYYEKENDWWICKQIKKPICSTVTCIDWHPNNVLLAVGACDFKARVFSAYVKEVDEKPSPNPWGTKMPFGALMCEVKSSGWIHHVAFSPSGCRMAYVAHDATIAVIDTNCSLEESVVLRTIYLPFTSVQWVTENSLIAAGHDYSPMLFMYSDEQLKFVTKLDVPSEQKTTNVNSAMQKFRNIDRNAAADAVDVRLKTLHQNAITEILPHSGRIDNMQKFSTCAIDGLVALWDLKGMSVENKNYLREFQAAIEYCQSAPVAV